MGGAQATGSDRHERNLARFTRLSAGFNDLASSIQKLRTTMGTIAWRRTILRYDVLSAMRSQSLVSSVRTRHSSMEANMHDVSVATMRHKGAVRVPHKRGTGTRLLKS